MRRTRYGGRVPLLLLCAAAMATATACTSGGPAAGGAGPTAAGPAAVWADFVACARANGQPNWPDAVVEDDGTVDFPPVRGFDVKTAFDAVKPACGAVLDRLP